MIYLYSATPGTGKTCYVVKQLIEKWTKDDKYKDRKIYANIEGLKIEGVHTPPDDFRQCDDGSIIIYDEAQDIKYYSSETRDDPVARALSKHRHRGFDIHFITQDPALLNKWVLKNVYMHYYLWRPAQTQNITIYTFARAIVSPTKQDFKSAFDKRLWRFEKYYLQFYKSTVINTSEKVGSSKRNSILMTGFILACVIAYFIRPLFDIAKPPITTTNNTVHDGNAPSTDQQGQNPLPPNITQDQQGEVDNLQLQAQMAQLKRQLELYEQMLPKDYQVIKDNPSLQVRGVISNGKDCKAYNTHGDLMTLSKTDCEWYLQEPGRVHKAESTNRHQTYSEPHHPQAMPPQQPLNTQSHQPNPL